MLNHDVSPISEEAKQFIREKSLDGDWSDQQIAEHLKCSVPTIRKWRKKFNIKKTGQGNLIVDDTLITKKNINKSTLSEEEKLSAWKKYFKTTSRCKRLAKILLADDLDYFIETWCQYSMQLEDMRPSEEEQLELLIIYKIRMAHNIADYKKRQIHEEELAQKIAGKENQQLNMENEADRYVYEMINSNNRIMAELNEQLKTLTIEHNKLLNDMNATRAQREAQGKIGADTFLSLVRNLNERDKRREIGRYNEYMKLATQKEMDRLTEVHKYADGTLDRIILTSDKFDTKEKNDGK